MKVYLLIEDWATDGNGCGVAVEVYADRKLAEKRLSEKAEIVKLAKHHDKIDEVEGNYIDAYVDGWYDNDHDHIYIEEQEVKERL